LPPLNLYARVRFLLHIFAHETAGAARIRHSLLPLLRDNETQASGRSCRENADAHLLFEIRVEAREPSLPATNAKSLRKGALATKQSILLVSAKRDCFAEPIAMTIYATSAIAIGIVIAARIVCSVMICASSGASPPICRAST